MFDALLIGDSCLDVYSYGNCTRLSPEAPIPVFKEEYEIIKDGMVLNVNNNLNSFGLTTIVKTQKDKIIKRRIIDSKFKQHLIRIDTEPLIIQEILDIQTIDPDLYDCLVISDYDKGFLPPKICRDMCDLFKGKNIFVDSKKNDLCCFKNCFLKINEDENKMSYNINKNVKKVVTLGSNGAKYKDKLYPTQKVDVFDVCGAGDVFFSSFIFYYMKKKNIDLSIQFANICASISVKHSGVYTLTKEDREEAELKICI